MLPLSDLSVHVHAMTLVRAAEYEHPRSPLGVCFARAQRQCLVAITSGQEPGPEYWRRVLRHLKAGCPRPAGPRSILTGVTDHA